MPITEYIIICPHCDSKKAEASRNTNTGNDSYFCPDCGRSGIDDWEEDPLPDAVYRQIAEQNDGNR